MPKRIPITAAKKVAENYNCSQIILLAWDGTQTHVVTYGTTIKDCQQAADGGNKIKKFFGWPEELCNSIPARIKRKKQKKKIEFSFKDEKVE